MEVRIEIVRGDTTGQSDVDAVGNAANAQLAPGGGVAGAIHREAGPEHTGTPGNLRQSSPGNV